jgi:hypothetical protein
VRGKSASNGPLRAEPCCVSSGVAPNEYFETGF